MAKLHLYLDKRSPTKDGSCPVKVSVFHIEGGKKKRMLIPTGVMVQPKNWDSVKCQDKRNGANNALLSAYLDRAKEIITASVKRGVKLDFDRMKAALAGVDGMVDEQPKLLPYFRDHAATKRAARTKEIYLATADKIEAFAGEGVTFEDINHRWLQAFDSWMEQTMPSANARGIHLRNLRTVINAAIDDELTSNYPFRRFRIKQQETRKRSLNIEQLRQIFFSEVPSSEEYRDIFCLIFLLQGINITDLCNLKVGDYDGHRIDYRRSKTSKIYSIKVEPEAAAIIEKYKGKNGVYLLDILERWKRVDSYKSKMNKRLKQIFPDLPPLSTYFARHSYATMLAELDTPIEVISQALGHSYGSRVTAIYINPNQAKVDAANRKLIDYIWQK